MPVRIQLSRRKGWRMPENTVSVARLGFWGNPYRVELDEVRHTGEWDEDGNDIWTAGPWLCRFEGPHVAGIWFATKTEAAQRAVDLYRLRIERLALGAPQRERLTELRGKNLACWCKPDQPCHADVLLEVANAASAIEARRGATTKIGAVHESAVGNAETPNLSEDHP